MLKINNKYSGVLVIVALLSCLSFSNLYAQEEHQVVDTTVVPPSSETQIDSQSQDEEKYFLKNSESRLEDDSIHLRKIPDAAVKDMKNDDDFWYANDNTKPKESRSALQRPWVRTLLWIIIIGGFGAFLVWWLMGSNVGILRKKNLLIKTEREEAETDDIFAINYQAEIDKAAAAGNYRFAIRLMFLRLLRDLASKNIIQYKQERTNLDYLLQIQPTQYYHEFFRITRNYEYSWYGQFEVNQDIYYLIRNDFDNFNRRF